MIFDWTKRLELEHDKFATGWLNISHETAIFTGPDTWIPQTLSCSPLEIDESDIKNLNRLAEDLKERILFSVILYSGGESVPLGPKTVAMPFAVFFGVWKEFFQNQVSSPIKCQSATPSSGNWKTLFADSGMSRTKGRMDFLAWRFSKIIYENSELHSEFSW